MKNKKTKKAKSGGWLKVSEKTITDIKVVLGQKEMIKAKEIKRIEQKRDRCGTNNIVLAELFLECYDLLLNNIINFKGDTEEERYDKEIKNYLKQFSVKEGFSISEIREVLRGYDGGHNFGDNYREEDLDEIVKNNRWKILELVNLFFAVFKEDY